MQYADAFAAHAKHNSFASDEYPEILRTSKVLAAVFYDKGMKD